MNLSKSSYCRGIQCKKILWLEKHKPEEKQELDLLKLIQENSQNITDEELEELGTKLNFKYEFLESTTIFFFF